MINKEKLSRLIKDYAMGLPDNNSFWDSVRSSELIDEMSDYILLKIYEERAAEEFNKFEEVMRRHPLGQPAEGEELSELAACASRIAQMAFVTYYGDLRDKALDIAVAIARFDDRLDEIMRRKI